MFESIRVVWVCKRTFKRCLFFANRLKFRERERELGRLSTKTVELANEGDDEHRASREAGNGAHWLRE